MSVRERRIREFIETLSGFENSVMIDAYRHLVFAHMIAADGYQAQARLDLEYPAAGRFEARRGLDGSYAFALGSASDMLQASIEDKGQPKDVRVALRSLLNGLLSQGILDPGD
jgi:hypothetical protein